MERPEFMNRLDLNPVKLKQEFLEWAKQIDAIKGLENEHWDGLNDDLDFILRSKSQEKSQASILWERSEGCGMLAWIWIRT